jgi:phenylalanyl-tRNA synthetase alpha chain
MPLSFFESGVAVSFGWTRTQLERLQALDADTGTLDLQFKTAGERNRAFQQLQAPLVKAQRERLEALRSFHRRPALCRLESRLVDALVGEGFVQVATPTIMSRGLLARMSIDENSPLASQIFWLGDDKCLRPMLAPHLYFLLKDLLRLWEKPVRIFEIGSCFRRESQGGRHANEFTMLNLVEVGLPEEMRRERLEQFSALVTETAGIQNYRLASEPSAVYGETIDIVAGAENIEIGSAAMGPHPLDRPWRITDAWVGIGFGLERLLMVSTGSSGLGRVGRSLVYQDGIRLNI